MNKHPRTIAREIKRGQIEHFFDEGFQKRTVYSADYAETIARSKDSGKGPQLKLGYDFALAEIVGELISKKKYSPYAVLASFENEGWPTETRICEKTLYSYIYEGLIPGVSEKHLLLQGKGHKPRGSVRHHKNASFAAKSIIYRPEEVETRQTFGHWEGDTIVGGTGKSSECLLTLTERKTRTEIVRKIPDKSSESVVHALETVERELGTGDFKRLFKTITFDNGAEFADIDGIEKSAINKKRRTIIYFAHPYCASERGTNERHNGFIRRFIPKGCEMKSFSKPNVRKVQDWLNNYPRKILNGKTPAMLLKQEFSNQTMILRFFNITTKEAI